MSVPEQKGESKNGPVNKVQNAPVNNDDDDDLNITAIEDNSKDKLEQPDLANQNIIPRINTSSVFIGSTGGGKSTLVTNLVTKPQFFGGKRKDGKDWFDARILISPTALSDDVQKTLGLSKDEIETDLNKAVALLEALMKEQARLIQEKGADKAPKILLIFDDIVSHPKFMNNKIVLKTFIANRHHNFTNFISSQSWTKLPRAVRLQAKGIFFFEGSVSEVEKMCDEYCPPGLARADFRELVQFATRDDFSFLYINKSVPMKDRFRKNLKDIIQPDFFKLSTKNPDFALPPKEKSEENSKQNPTQKTKRKRTDTEELFHSKRQRPESVNRTIITGAQHGDPGTTSRRSAFRRGNFEQHSGTRSRFAKQKPQVRNQFRPKRLESSYFS